ncbi:MAG: ornithine carbamoyltransferase [Armatimonadetes bacterium]|nr:ornithine carbamoyltransferase [Armatimonadota bacterium]
MKGRHFLSVNDLTTEEIEQLFDLTREIKLGKAQKVAAGKCAALLFEKPSLRTKLSFSVGMQRLGGQALYFSREEVGLGQRESVKDAARVLSRMVDAIVIRTFDHKNIVELAHYASVPVINALTDLEHPCQALADFYTILEYRAETRGQKLVYIGDGCNTAISLMLLAPRLGTHFTLACPPGYEPPVALIQQAQELAAWHNTEFEISHDPVAAANDADILYTDVWTSMGQEDEKAKRLADFAGFQIGAKTLREAKEDALILHCLPAHYGEEITEDAVDSTQSGIFDQAENRLHVQQALLAAVL